MKWGGGGTLIVLCRNVCLEGEGGAAELPLWPMIAPCKFGQFLGSGPNLHNLVNRVATSSKFGQFLSSVRAKFRHFLLHNLVNKTQSDFFYPFPFRTRVVTLFRQKVIRLGGPAAALMFVSDRGRREAHTKKFFFFAHFLFFQKKSLPPPQF